ncbi:hypothetical protein CLV31_101279 [Algoriphagus aquaeductus]|uniref:Uncharacterized protein n=1 Tax=Algoriphagus aquaeductus TaxID=475299 RepID=A0A326SBI8_9BACT|nr:hypothetical protein CLV31_101279 [Algoriphagus aquaeductus]
MAKDRRILDFHLFEKFLKLAKFTGMKADIQITVKVIFSLQDLLNEKTILFFLPAQIRWKFSF